MSNKTYDRLKLVSMIIGYVATLILTLTDIWGFEYGAAIAATVSALGVALGGILTDATKKYHEAHAEEEELVKELED